MTYPLCFKDTFKTRVSQNGYNPQENALAYNNNKLSLGAYLVATVSALRVIFVAKRSVKSTSWLPETYLYSRKTHSLRNVYISRFITTRAGNNYPVRNSELMLLNLWLSLDSISIPFISFAGDSSCVMCHISENTERHGFVQTSG